MDIEKLGYEAIGIIKEKFGLPMKGILCGGSISNIIWELVSGNKSVINDIDIFFFEEIVNDIDNDLFLKNVNNDYCNYLYNTQTNFIYSITNSIYENKLNKTYLRANKYDILSLVKSFDINCVQIAYSIENDKFYWTEEFEEFLKNGKLKITSLRKPSKTAIRLIKKSKDLNIDIDELEINLLKYVILHKSSLNDVDNNFYQKKYLDYLKNKEYLDKYFSLESSESDIGDKSYSFVVIPKPKVKNTSIKNLFINYLSDEEYDESSIFKIENQSINFTNSDIFLFYMRNIHGDDKKKIVWDNLKPFYHNKNYYDNRVTLSDIYKISSICKIYPKTYQNISNMTLYDQSNILNKLLERFEPNIAFSIIGKFKLKSDIVFNNINSLIFEISVRKESNNIKKNDIFNRIK